MRRRYLTLIKAHLRNCSAVRSSKTLSDLLDSALPDRRKVQMLPLACKRQSKTWVEWTGVDTILGPLADPSKIPRDRFELRSETICRELLFDGDRVTGAKIPHG